MADIPNTIVNLPNRVVDLFNTMVDLPNTMVELPNTMVDLPNTMVFFFFLMLALPTQLAQLIQIPKKKYHNYNNN